MNIHARPSFLKNPAMKITAINGVSQPFKYNCFSFNNTSLVKFSCLQIRIM